MSSTTEPDARPERRVGPLRVALTRAASALGSTLAEQVALAGDRVVGLDVTAGAAADVDWRVGDIASPSVVGALGDVDVLVHLAWEHDLGTTLREQPAARRARMVSEARTLTTAAAAAGVGHLVLVTSAMVYGARPDNPVPVPDASALRTTDTEGLVADLVAVEEETTALARLHPGLRLTVVRPAALVGPGIDTMITRHFEAPRLLTLRGTTPAWTFCHAEDLGSALVTVVHEPVPAEVTVSAWGALSQAEVEEISGMRRVELSVAAAQAAADRLHRLGVIPVPATDLAYVTHPWVTEPTALAEHGWYPAYDNAACLSVLLEGVRGHHAVMARRLRSRDAVGAAAAGAASAAVAVIATAALMRRRRSRD
ncbi:NAD-dependent epimerase/dehydratase family protein [Ornithinimicrobium pekingense]|uniref:NAD-dependent dehydratase n=1 Tax=Ornithinimicrobium pekingense TaxID=384677 RepID=A0ABQ2F9Z3_9MICO|nr:NAD-dependent epimerase/dehydratase family protein [Ornithinimicrobium pekingense]GGK65467.1 NAD-dependent dehydratase [Ornithinimicrobium pekingense]